MGCGRRREGRRARKGSPPRPRGGAQGGQGRAAGGSHRRAHRRAPHFRGRLSRTRVNPRGADRRAGAAFRLGAGRPPRSKACARGAPQAQGGAQARRGAGSRCTARLSRARPRGIFGAEAGGLRDAAPPSLPPPPPPQPSAVMAALPPPPCHAMSCHAGLPAARHCSRRRSRQPRGWGLACPPRDAESGAGQRGIRRAPLSRMRGRQRARRSGCRRRLPRCPRGRPPAPQPPPPTLRAGLPCASPTGRPAPASRAAAAPPASQNPKWGRRRAPP